MNDQIVAAIVVFGVLFAICMIGLFASNAASARLSGGPSTIASERQRAFPGSAMAARS